MNFFSQYLFKEKLSVLFILFASLCQGQEVEFRSLTEKPINFNLVTVKTIGKFGILTKHNSPTPSANVELYTYDYEAKELKNHDLSELNNTDKNFAISKLPKSTFIGGKLFFIECAGNKINMEEYDPLKLTSTGSKKSIEFDESLDRFTEISENEDYFMVSWNENLITQNNSLNSNFRKEESIIAYVIDKKTLKVVTECLFKEMSGMTWRSMQLTEDGGVSMITTKVEQEVLNEITVTIKNYRFTDTQEFSFRAEGGESWDFRVIKDSSNYISSVVLYALSKDRKVGIQLLQMQDDELVLISDKKNELSEVFREDKTFYTTKSFKSEKNVSLISFKAVQTGFSSIRKLKNGDYFLLRELIFYGHGGSELKILSTIYVSSKNGIQWVKYIPVGTLVNSMLDQNGSIHIFFNEPGNRYDDSGNFVSFINSDVANNFEAIHLSLDKDGDILKREILFKAKDERSVFYISTVECEDDLILWRVTMEKGQKIRMYRSQVGRIVIN